MTPRRDAWKASFRALSVWKASFLALPRGCA